MDIFVQIEWVTWCFNSIIGLIEDRGNEYLYWYNYNNELLSRFVDFLNVLLSMERSSCLQILPWRIELISKGRNHPCSRWSNQTTSHVIGSVVATISSRESSLFGLLSSTSHSDRYTLMSRYDKSDLLNSDWSAAYVSPTTFTICSFKLNEPSGSIAFSSKAKS